MNTRELQTLSLLLNAITAACVDLEIDLVDGCPNPVRMPDGSMRLLAAFGTHPEIVEVTITIAAEKWGRP